ncbi:MAG TPA: ATP-binding cassette domain-containing protein [Candidatus Limnocylindrales bacterium]|nr:ATP-binding cassette domain-containing protein [Candidatus Limnocylindrales bacterium]
MQRTPVEPEALPETPAGLDLSGITVRYPGTRADALADVSVAVEPGAIGGLTGRTGAGKSTLALTAAGFVPRVVRARVTGAASVAGIEVLRAPASDVLGRIGIVFATPANQLSASKLSVREELAFGLENLGVPRSEMDARIEATLDRLGIGHLADREPFALSGGEQQRVAIASIVAMGTRVLILDEPTAQLDPFGTTLVADLLEELARDGSAVLVAEQDPAVLARTRRTTVLDHGQVVATADPAVALSPETLEPTGLPSPTIVRLGWMAGLEPAGRFDLDAVSTRLAAAATAGRLRSSVLANEPNGPSATEPWASVRDQAPVSITIEGLSHRYEATALDAIRDVALTIEPGEAVAIVGQNGSGKTTLVKHLNGLLRPSSGRVRIGGEDIATASIDEIAGRVGFVFQSPDDQLFERSVEREIAFGPRNLGLRPDALARAIEMAVEAVALGDVRSTNPYDLDLSRRKLVALAGVLAMDPAVLVLDEPTTGQDPLGIRRVGAVVDRLRAAGRTVVAVTHDMEFAADHFSRVIVMTRGEVVLDGPPAAVFAAERTALLARAGIERPVAARVGERLGLGSTPTEAALLAALSASVH